MCRLLFCFAVAAVIGALSGAGAATKAAAQTYPIDCAILLCLSGGWPASEPCARARAEFIRRITPWPVEPPLQIWRCPMGVAYQPAGNTNLGGRIYDILFDGRGTLPQSFPVHPLSGLDPAMPSFLRSPLSGFDRSWSESVLELVQDRADIDISGPEFNFVRSIRVYDVRFARQRESGRDGDCNRSATVVLGTYGTQGEFSWRSSSPGDLPEAHVGVERWGEDCPSIYHRSVFVDWRDYRGNYGFEQVNY
ncbi:hypothetical protein [Salipiger abyssi]|uniref:hypothetical protein n=1 Tax=Salipiger abyssi TaxID=1250539 RepID=UPI00269FD2AC